MNEPRDAMQIAADVRHGRASAVGVLEQTFDRIARLDPTINAFTSLVTERAFATARGIDARVACGEDPGPLAGVPFAVKNLFDIAGEVTLAGSLVLRERPPAAVDAFAIRRLEAAGAVLIGALNMDEFAYGFSTENQHYGTTRNPHDPSRIGGGSSGGSAAGVAGGMVPLALGTDTNGSVRVPAALCGVFGMKPTFGRLSRSGSFPFVSTLDHVGVFARTLRDLVAAYDALQGRDAEDRAQIEEPLRSDSTDRGAGTELRVAVLGGWFAASAGAGVLDAVDRLAAALGTSARVDVPASDVARAAAFCLTGFEGGTLHLPELRSQPGKFDAAVKNRLRAGALLPAELVAKAERIRAWYRQRILEVFDRYDLLLAPATICAAPPIGQATVRHGDHVLVVRASLGLYTQPISFVGLPVVTVPAVPPSIGTGTDDLPIGVQIIAAPWREDLVLRLAARLERCGAIASKPYVEPGRERSGVPKLEDQS